MSNRPVPKKRQEQHGVSRIEYVNALLDNPALYQVADLIEGPDPSRGGRPRKYPDWVILFFDCLADVVGSARGAATELAGEDGHLWNHVRQKVEQRFPDRADLHLPPISHPGGLQPSSAVRAGLTGGTPDRRACRGGLTGAQAGLRRPRRTRVSQPPQPRPDAPRGREGHLCAHLVQQSRHPGGRRGRPRDR